MLHAFLSLLVFGGLALTQHVPPMVGSASNLSKRFNWGTATVSEYEPQIEEAIRELFPEGEHGVEVALNPDIGVLRFLRDAAKASVKGLDDAAVEARASAADMLDEWKNTMKWLATVEDRLVAARAKLALHEYNSLKTSHKAVKNILKLTALGTASAVGVAGVEGGEEALRLLKLPSAGGTVGTAASSKTKRSKTAWNHLMDLVEKLKAKYEWPYLKLSTDPKAEFSLTELAYFQYVGRRPGVTGDQLWAGALATQFLEQFETGFNAILNDPDASPRDRRLATKSRDLLAIAARNAQDLAQRHGFGPVTGQPNVAPQY